MIKTESCFQKLLHHWHIFYKYCIEDPGLIKFKLEASLTFCPCLISETPWPIWSSKSVKNCCIFLKTFLSRPLYIYTQFFHKFMFDWWIYIMTVSFETSFLSSLFGQNDIPILEILVLTIKACKCFINTCINFFINIVTKCYLIAIWARTFQPSPFH